ncbi:MAG: nickel pincer cofactor biosynthesis protein LarB [Desulfobacterales bacterium]|nr:nickel pincer cofactor biosynthesis protein LarB [Desulfobacterales bacterium]
MNMDTLIELLKGVSNGKIQVDQAAHQLKHLAYEDIDFAHIDHHRSLRKGFPEVIFGEGKTAAQIEGILAKMTVHENTVLVTRVDASKAEIICNAYPQAVYHTDARIILWEKQPPAITGRGTILIISAGTSDIPVAREAMLTAGAMGNRVETVYDIGVAGIHRLMAHRDLIEDAAVLIVVAGMEGALPSVVAGLTASPVIAVPTSIGYGVSLGGLTALFGMLSSCSSNVAVVNIDNGFGAGYMASAINHI